MTIYRQYTMYSFPNFEPVCCSVSNSNCCFLSCVQISQETGKVLWYSHLLKNFPQFVVIHTGFCDSSCNNPLMSIYKMRKALTEPVFISPLVSAVDVISVGFFVLFYSGQIYQRYWTESLICTDWFSLRSLSPLILSLMDKTNRNHNVSS